MKLYLPRMFFGETTLGHLYTGTEHFCYTLEDKVRAPGIKIYGKTAIPEGVYEVIVTYSPKFKRKLPLILNVPLFTGIRIHRGATIKNTLGCIIAGYTLTDNEHTSSDCADDDLTKLLLAHKGEKHTIEIVNTKKVE